MILPFCLICVSQVIFVYMIKLVWRRQGCRLLFIELFALLYTNNNTRVNLVSIIFIQFGVFTTRTLYYVLK